MGWNDKRCIAPDRSFARHLDLDRAYGGSFHAMCICVSRASQAFETSREGLSYELTSKTDEQKATSFDKARR